MFDLAIDSKLRGCDVVEIKIGELVVGSRTRNRAIVVQRRTGWPIQFELLDPAQGSILAWLEHRRQGVANAPLRSWSSGRHKVATTVAP